MGNQKCGIDAIMGRHDCLFASGLCKTLSKRRLECSTYLEGASGQFIRTKIAQRLTKAKCQPQRKRPPSNEDGPMTKNCGTAVA